MVKRTDYDALAAVFDRRYAGDDYAPVERYLAARVAPGARVLDVGCGTGHWLAWLEARGAIGFGVEPSAAMLARARGPRRVRGRAEALPFGDARFDHLILVNVLHHVDDRAAFAREAHRVLAPGGALTTLGLDPHTGLDRWWIYDTFDGALARDRARYPSTAAIRGWLGDAGFGEVASEIAMHAPVETTIGAARAAGRLAKSATSQLAILDDDEYAAGLARLAARGDDAAIGADLRLWATTGRRP